MHPGSSASQASANTVRRSVASIAGPRRVLVAFRNPVVGEKQNCRVAVAVPSVTVVLEYRLRIHLASAGGITNVFVAESGPYVPVASADGFTAASATL